MALALAHALEEANGFSPDVVWRHFRTWSATAKDVGITISHSLRAKSHGVGNGSSSTHAF
jgi:hypothetical protein